MLSTLVDWILFFDSFLSPLPYLSYVYPTRDNFLMALNPGHILLVVQLVQIAILSGVGVPSSIK